MTGNRILHMFMRKQIRRMLYGCGRAEAAEAAEAHISDVKFEQYTNIAFDFISHVVVSSFDFCWFYKSFAFSSLFNDACSYLQNPEALYIPGIDIRQKGFVVSCIVYITYIEIWTLE